MPASPAPADRTPRGNASDTAGPVRLRAAVLFHYAAPLVSGHFIYMMVLVMYMNFATDVLGVAPGIIGTIFFLSKIWDAISDPMVGYWSDRTRSRFGRRRSWMLASTLPLAAVSIMIWSPPEWLGEEALIAWIAVSVFSFYTVYTIYTVPQLALGAELSPEPTERGRAFGARQIALTLGMLLAFVFATPMLVDAETARASARMLAWAGALVTATAIAGCTLALPAERKDYAGRGATSPVAAMRDVLRNPHARLLLLVYFIEIFGIGGTSAMTVYLLKYITKAADYVGVVFLAYTIPAIASIPLWVSLGQRYERHRVWLFAMGLSAVGYGGIMFQDEGRIALMFFTVLVSGFASGCGQTLGQAIKADVIDYDEYLTGERKEGAYYATWNLAGKLGTGLMMALAGWALQASGFEKNVEQTELTRRTILLLMGGAPFLCMLIGMLAFRRFSLTSAEHARIRAEIDARNS
ncbi:MAG: MFS transporter [Deltaproteobacteria bacterium]|nr:MFS transporter [Deltaproteobacteria bacterium]MBW2362737.1 MFS transporter [Deltaproteobacteria bacterium]